MNTFHLYRTWTISTETGLQSEDEYIALTEGEHEEEQANHTSSGLDWFGQEYIGPYHKEATQ